MIGKIAAFALAASLLCGCSNIDRLDLPKNPVTGTPSVASISARLNCELAYLVSDEYRFSRIVRMAHLIVGVQLDLAVTNNGSLAPSLNFADKVFSFNAGAKLEVSREQQFTERLYFSLDEIYSITKGKIAPPDPQGLTPYSCPKVDTYLAGDLGLAETVEMAFLTPDLDLYQTKLQGSSGAFGGYVNFIVTRNLNTVGPTWTLKHFKGGGVVGFEEKNNHRLTVAFASKSATGEPPGIVLDRFLDRLITNQIVTGLANIRSSP